MPFACGIPPMPARMVHHPFALGDGELAEQEESFARRGCDPVGIAAAGIKERGLRGPGRLLRQIDQFVLDFETGSELRICAR